MITVDTEQCTGCGACVEVCPTGAVYLVEGKAMVDEALCRECEACLAACPSGAIALAAPEQPGAEAARVPALRPEGHRRPEPEVIRVRAQPAPAPLRYRVWPVVGAVLAWAGRAIVPRLADVLLDTLDRQATGPQAAGAARSSGTLMPGTKGRQHRHRRRGG